MARKTDIHKVKELICDVLVEHSQIACGEGVSNVDEIHERARELSDMAIAIDRISNPYTRSIKRIKYHLKGIFSEEFTDGLINELKGN